MHVVMIPKITPPRLPPEQDLIGTFSNDVGSDNVSRRVELLYRFPVVVSNQQYVAVDRPLQATAQPVVNKTGGVRSAVQRQFRPETARVLSGPAIERNKGVSL